MTGSAKPRKSPPKDLQTSGKLLWRATFERYELTSTEIALLHELCRTADECDTLAAAMAGQGAVSVGSRVSRWRIRCWLSCGRIVRR